MPTLKANIGGTWVPIGYAPPTLFSATQPGIVPASGGGTLNFLRADGTWGQPPTAAISWPQTAQLSDQSTYALTVNATTHATSERAGIRLGGWLIGQDLNANGGLDFFLYQLANNRLFFEASADALTLKLGNNYAGATILLGGGTDAKVGIGNDTFFRDVNVANMLKLEGASNPALGMLCFGSSAKHVGNDGNMVLKSDTPIYYDGQQHLFRNVSGSPLFQHDGSNFTNSAGYLYSPSGFRFWYTGYVMQQLNDDCGIYYWGADDIGFVAQGQERIRAAGGTLFMTGPCYFSNEVYAGVNCWFAARGSTGFRWQDYGGGFYMDDSATVKVYNGKNIKTASGQLISSKVVGGAYWDQALFTDAGSTMAGMGWHPGGVAGTLRMQYAADTFHFQNTDASGYYRCAAREWAIASSERYKQEVVPLRDSLPMLPDLPVATMVRALRPVWFRTDEHQQMAEVPACPDDVAPEDWRPTEFPLHVCRVETCGHTPDDPCSWRVNWQRGLLGFIAEEVERVLPQLVRLDTDMRPWALDLGSLVGLAYAMLQELDSRLTALEAA